MSAGGDGEGVSADRVRARGPVPGRAEAPVALIEHSGFQCPSCGRLAPESTPGLLRA